MSGILLLVLLLGVVAAGVYLIRRRRASSPGKTGDYLVGVIVAFLAIFLLWLGIMVFGVGPAMRDQADWGAYK